MADRHQVVTSESWGSRLRGAFGGIVVGFVFVAAGVLLLFWNEGRAVKRAKALAEGAASVVTVDAGAVDPGQDGRLVHFTGRAEAVGTVRDPLFRIESDALELHRQVEMYQWEEKVESKTEKKLGGGTETVKSYDYRKTWSSRAISSSGFEVRAGHENPPFPIEGKSWVQKPITVGERILSDRFVGKLTRRQPLQVGPEALSAITARFDRPLHADGGGFYLGADPGSPEIGDVRIRFEETPPAEVSVVGRQQGAEVVPYTTRNDSTLALLDYGIQGADQMFEAAERANNVTTWILRLVGWLATFLGLGMIFRPLSVLADVVPAIGNLVGVGTKSVAFVLSLALSFLTIAVGWIFYRPLLGLLLLAVAVALAVWIWKRLEKSPAPSAPPPVPPSSSAPPPPPPVPPSSS